MLILFKAVSTASSAFRQRIRRLPLPKPVRSAILPRNRREIWRMSVKNVGSV
jgi:hypothetical protein